MDTAHGSMSLGGRHTTGGLVEMDERGRLIRSGATAEWVQVWRLGDLKLLETIRLPPGPRGDENRFTGEPRLLPDGKTVYVHTFRCGLYLLRHLDRPQPIVAFVHGSPGKNCAVPLVAGRFWLQPVPETHALVSMDITDPAHPREVSSQRVGDGEEPHWIAMDPTGRRVVLNSGGYAKTNRSFIIDFAPTTGALSLDRRFHDPDDTVPGVRLSARTWPHGFTGTAAPHGTVFST